MTRTDAFRRVIEHDLMQIDLYAPRIHHSSPLSYSIFIYGRVMYSSMIYINRNNLFNHTLI